MNHLSVDLSKKFSGKKCILLGAGVSNMPLAKMLCGMGAEVEVRDKKSAAEMGERGAELLSLGVRIVSGEGYLEHMRADYIFRSPGFRPDIPELREAAAAGAVITAEMDEFIENCPCTVIGVTGSDGKSTTTTLISLIVKEEGVPDRTVFLGGNIGEPLLNRIGDMKSGDVVCAELSSFQLMTVSAPVDIAVIKNVTPNHLNWHTGMDEYIAAKARILRGCKKAVLNYDDEVCREASYQEIIRRYFASACAVKKGIAMPEELRKQEMLMNSLHLDVSMRRTVPAARAKAAETGAPAAAIELPDSRIVTGKTSGLMGASCAALLNAIKLSAGIDDRVNLISPMVLAPIQHLKIEHLGNSNPRLHTDEVLIALSISAVTNPTAELAMEALASLRGSQVHSSVILSSVDEGMFKRLGMNVTFEPVYQSHTLYHK